MNEAKLIERQERADKVNQLVRVIGQHGRKFFFDSRKKSYAQMIVGENGRLWWRDENTGKSIYLHYKYWGRGFSNGGTLRSLVNDLKQWVMSGQPLPERVFGPWPKWYSNGDLWGYGSDMETVRQLALELGLLVETAVGEAS